MIISIIDVLYYLHLRTLREQEEEKAHKKRWFAGWRVVVVVVAMVVERFAVATDINKWESLIKWKMERE